jgi:hypothetical protein
MRAPLVEPPLVLQADTHWLPVIPGERARYILQIVLFHHLPSPAQCHILLTIILAIGGNRYSRCDDAMCLTELLAVITGHVIGAHTQQLVTLVQGSSKTLYIVGFNFDLHLNISF